MLNHGAKISNGIGVGKVGFSAASLGLQGDRMKYLLALSMLVAPLFVSGAPSGNCDGAPKEAIVELPSPIDDWGQILCTPYGHILSAKEGWLWTNPGGYSPVMIPSQMVRSEPKQLGNESYFTEINLVVLEGKEAEESIALFETGFDKSESPPRVYSLQVVSVAGKTLGFRFFDFGSSAWGMWCNKECKPSSRFMLLDMSKRTNQ